MNCTAKSRTIITGISPYKRGECLLLIDEHKVTKNYLHSSHHAVTNNYYLHELNNSVTCYNMLFSTKYCLYRYQTAKFRIISCLKKGDMCLKSIKSITINFIINSYLLKSSY